MLTLPIHADLAPTARNPVRLVPHDMPRAHASGPAPHRILLVSSEASCGEGVRTHELGLAGSLARALATRTGHGADVDIAVTAHAGIPEVERLLRQRDLTRFDGLVLLLETPRSRAALAAAKIGLRRLLVELATRTAPAAPITVALAPASALTPLAGLSATARSSSFRHIAAAACGAAAGMVELPHLLATDPRDRYRTWGEALAAQVSLRLRQPGLWRSPLEMHDETARQQAVDALPLHGSDWEDEFTGFLTLVREAYGTRNAAISLIDRGLTRYVARQGFETVEMARDETLCATALITRDGLILSDARDDTRFHACLPVTAGSVGFYAGYRIEDAHAQPVAVLCVFDPEPRTVGQQDLALLRDFAIAAERCLWELARPAYRKGSGSRCGGLNGMGRHSPATPFSPTARRAV